jgi:ABC-type uncharacterized transport system ATPase component
MNFAGLRLSGWRQFSSVEIRFDRRLTIITGANGAGKSTILNILIQHFGPHRPYLGVPVAIDGVRRFVTSVFRLRSRVVKWFSNRSDPNWVTVGSLTYDAGAEAQLMVPTQGQQSYSLQITSQQSVLGSQTTRGLLP